MIKKLAYNLLAALITLMIVLCGAGSGWIFIDMVTSKEPVGWFPMASMGSIFVVSCFVLSSVVIEFRKS